MAGSSAGVQGRRNVGGAVPPRTPGPLGVRDQGDPRSTALAGDTPGPLGQRDHGEPLVRVRSEPGPPAPQSGPDLSDKPVSGSVAVGVGMGAVVRIPVPGSGGLALEFSPRGWTPKGGSTSTLFIQDPTGKRVLRLDYGYNKNTGKIDYHWNQKGTAKTFGISDHTPAAKGGRNVYQAAKYFRYGGRVLVVLGAAVDIYSIVVARKRWRQVARVAAGWGGAWLGCKVVGAGGGAAGTFVEPGLGTAIGGAVGCIAGGIGGYFGASWAAGELYDWVEETYFVPLPELAAP